MTVVRDWYLCTCKCFIVCCMYCSPLSTSGCKSTPTCTDVKNLHVNTGMSVVIYNLTRTFSRRINLRQCQMGNFGDVQNAYTSSLNLIQT